MDNTTARPEARVWPAILAAKHLDGTAMAGFGDADWRNMVEAACAHGLGVTLAAQLRRLGLFPAVPAEQRQTLDGLQRAGVMRALQRRHLLQRALAALQAAGVVPVPYKGAALAFLTYPEPCMRPMGDFDLWVEACDMKPAIDALHGLGYRQRLDRVDRPLAWQSAHEGEVQMRHPEFGLIELHWGVFPGEWLQRVARIDRAAVAGRLVDARLFGHPIRLLSPRDHLVQVALHASISDRLSLHALRNLLDIALLGDAMGDDWDALLADARAWRIERVLAHAFLVAGQLFERERLLAVGTHLHGRRSARHLLAHVSAQDVLQGRGIFRDWRRWSYLGLAADRPIDTLALASHAVWPSAEWLRQRYGRDGLGQRCRHALSALRGQL